MSYRCKVCEQPVPPGTPIRKHVIYQEGPPDRDGGRPRRDIVSETPVCSECHRVLRNGVPLDRLTQQYRRSRQPVVREKTNFTTTEPLTLGFPVEVTVRS